MKTRSKHNVSIFKGKELDSLLHSIHIGELTNDFARFIREWGVNTIRSITIWNGENCGVLQQKDMRTFPFTWD